MLMASKQIQRVKPALHVDVQCSNAGSSYVNNYVTIISHLASMNVVQPYHGYRITEKFDSVGRGTLFLYTAQSRKGKFQYNFGSGPVR